MLLKTTLYQKVEKQRLDIAKEELESLHYHPVRERKSVSGGENECCVRPKKLKRCNSCEALKLFPPIFGQNLEIVLCFLGQQLFLVYNSLTLSFAFLNIHPNSTPTSILCF